MICGVVYQDNAHFFCALAHRLKSRLRADERGYGVPAAVLLRHRQYFVQILFRGLRAFAACKNEPAAVYSRKVYLVSRIAFFLRYKPVQIERHSGRRVGKRAAFGSGKKREKLKRGAAFFVKLNRL